MILWRRRHAFAALTSVALSIGAGALAALSLVCTYDPVPQATIDRLPEEEGEPSPTHRPGEPCVACHSAYEGADPPLSIGGTVYTIDANGNLAGAPGVLVLVSDAEGDSRKACTNASGNFYVERDKWPDPYVPLKVQAGSRTMQSIVGRDGSCATCHTLPNELSLDPMTGAGRSSAGVVLVELADLGQCQGGS
jgi:hypothetical protein